MPAKIKFILYAVGPAFLLLGVFLLYSSYYKLTHYPSVTGKVIRTIKNGYGKGNYFYPEIQFTTNNQQTITFDYYSYPPTFYTTGDIVTILYNSKDPNDATINSFMTLWFWATMSLVIGAAGIWIIYKFRSEINLAPPTKLS
jgi:hypothetical protein